jgi:hypothetical protein
VSVKDNVHNKAGQSVPTDQRDYQFTVAPMRLRFSNPAVEDAGDGSFLLGANDPVDFFWTAAVAVKSVSADGKTITSTVDPAQVQIFSADNKNVGPDNPDGDADTAVCDTGGTAVDPTTIRPLVRGATAATTALVLRLDVMGGAAPLTTRWKPNTTYRIQFGPNAKVTPVQGGPDGTFPADFKLCFHTSAPPA